ncbi:OTU domain [Trinorchestia longiramus]|nr:OTU domain [Trinorchestia longiramus]
MIMCANNNNHKNDNDRKTPNHIKPPHGKFLNHISESSSNPIYTQVGSSLDDVTTSLNATLAQTLADGHCFLHAVALQLNETPNSMQAYKFLIKAIETESTRNKNHYRNFLDENSGRLDLLVQKYLHRKIFDHAAGDLIPQITSNALQKLIHIYSERDGGIWKTIVQPTMPQNINKSPLLVHLKDYHYSALIKEKNASINKILASR